MKADTEAARRPIAGTPDHTRASGQSPLQPTGQQTVKEKKERGHPPIAPNSEKHARRLLERSTAVPIKRFDSADYFLSQYIDHQKAEAARLAMSARRRQSLAHPSQPGSPTPPQHSSTRFPVFDLPLSPSRLPLASSCKINAGSPTPDAMTLHPTAHR